MGRGNEILGDFYLSLFFVLFESVPQANILK